MTCDEIHLGQMPGFCRAIVEACYFDLGIVASSKQYYVKLDIVLVGVHLPVAIHNLESISDLALNHLVVLNEGHSLVVGDGVEDGFREQEPSVYKEIEEQTSHEGTSLVVSEFD